MTDHIHGTSAQAEGRRCRCDDCRSAHAAYVRAWRAAGKTREERRYELLSIRAELAVMSA